jgi:outer membrane lipoprotein-sorting protein
MMPIKARRSLLLLPLLALPRLAQAEPFPLAALMARLASVAERRAIFREQRRFAALTETLQSSGRLLYRRPDYLEKTTEWPVPERMVIDGSRLIITPSGNEPPQVVDLASQPELRTMMEAIRGPLAGDRDALQQSFQVQAGGTLEDWTLELTPRAPNMAKLLRVVRLAGSDSWIHDIRLVQANGDDEWMQIERA